MTRMINVALLTILAAPLPASAEGPNSTSGGLLRPNQIRPGFQQFQSWYPKYETMFEAITAGPCARKLADYHASYFASASSEEGNNIVNTCYATEACILQNLTSDVLANFQSATVILGLLPTLLAQLGPSVAETSLLSAHRPFLSLLISLGAPAVWPTRVFGFCDPALVLSRPNELALKPRKPSVAVAISITEYLCMGVAVWNIVSTSIAIAYNSILVWGCTTTFAPLLWTSLASVVHLAAASSYWLAIRPKNLGHSSGVSLKPSTLTIRKTEPKKGIRRALGKLTMAWKSEATICANQPKRLVQPAKMPPEAVFLNVVAGALGFLHLAFGTIALSSLAFISVWDAMTHIVTRYVASTVICRLVLIVEMAGLRQL